MPFDRQPIVLAGCDVRLEPIAFGHDDHVLVAAKDHPERWTVTVQPRRSWAAVAAPHVGQAHQPEVDQRRRRHEVGDAWIAADLQGPVDAACAPG